MKLIDHEMQEQSQPHRHAVHDAPPAGKAEQRLSITVYYEDTDAGGVVYYANYLRFLERARTEWLRSRGIEQSWLLKTSGLAFAVRSLSAEFLKPARLDDRLTVSAAIASYKRAQVVFDQRIERGDELLVSAQVRIACLDLARGKPAALPAELMEHLTR